MRRNSRWVLMGCGVAFLCLIAGLLISSFIGGEKKIQQHLKRLYALDDPRFMQELGVLLGPPFLQGTGARALLNGDEIFPPMLAAIRAGQGVKVHVLLDWVGSAKMEDGLIAQMTQAGVQVKRFHPPHWSNLGRMNNRTHRKLLVVDGRVGFTGGVGVAPQWTGRAQNPSQWRDTHFEVLGPVVAQMQAVFIDNWIKVTGDVLHGPDYFPALAPVGTAWAQMFSSSPSGGSESMQLMYLRAVTSASVSIDLSAAYFVPDTLNQQALVDALKRGVRLRIVVPGKHIDSDAVRGASRATWGPLLSAGATIAEYGPTMYHCKLMIVDGLLTSVGSTNFDNRSFRLNDEATLNIVDPAFARAQTATFESDLALSHRVSHAEWQNRPVREKLGERLASLLSAQR